MLRVHALSAMILTPVYSLRFGIGAVLPIHRNQGMRSQGRANRTRKTVGTSAALISANRGLVGRARLY